VALWQKLWVGLGRFAGESAGADLLRSTGLPAENQDQTFLRRKDKEAFCALALVRSERRVTETEESSPELAPVRQDSRQEE